MSGHSKFANIKHKKEKNDAAKGKIFTIIGKEIAIAVKEGGANPDNNSKLRDVIAKAKANNMPNDTIKRGIDRAAGDANSVNYVANTYEGYGPNGTAIIVDTLTDNTPAEVKAMSTPLKSSLCCKSFTSICLPRKVYVVPALRLEPNKTNSSIGKFLSSSTRRNSCPTAPLTPTIATFIFFFC